MILNTLGPKSTDSYEAAKFVKNKIFPKINIQLHDSFDDIYENLSELEGECILVPVAYRSSSSSSNWVDNNYKYWNKLDIINTFVLSTMPMLLVKNDDIKIKNMILHPSTIAYLKDFENEFDININAEFDRSKPIVLDKFINENFRYSIVSENLLNEYINNKIINFNVDIIHKYQPKMIWCIYKVH
ncbi:hypothetical protein [Apilactobacillus timberlakei]|uniref:Prephenate dehydratase n=1 Tax=Apilactobacillus timberlakei TaxID=2008380 RepID=A0ABY2YSP1_9LACO|nr:hypothetical protein [Apilactobacillus timberlakei]TPR14314.1 hypothetical protein DY048_05040 [Apilactobacillus timberlakei]TPR16567.1 hypothetical protein DY052_03130 [Apilactobacillus timberlakei]